MLVHFSNSATDAHTHQASAPGAVRLRRELVAGPFVCAHPAGWVGLRQPATAPATCNCSGVDLRLSRWHWRSAASATTPTRGRRRARMQSPAPCAAPPSRSSASSAASAATLRCCLCRSTTTRWTTLRSRRAARPRGGSPLSLACWPAALTGALPRQAAAHLAALVLALGLESFLRVQHRRQQQAGYLAFYWRTRGLLSIPTRAAALAQARCAPGFPTLRR